jgi:hypothetical protein
LTGFTTIQRMKKSFKYIFVMTLFMNRIGASNLPSNLELLVMTIDSAWSAKLQTTDFDTRSIYGFQNDSNGDPLYQLIVDRLVTCLQTRNIPLLLTGDSTMTRVVRLQVFNAGIRYIRSGRDGLFGKKWMEREALFHVNLQVRDQGRVLINRDIMTVKKDRFPWNQINYVEQRGQILGFPDRPVFADWLTRLETVMMITSAGVVILLFYIIRS